MTSRRARIKGIANIPIRRKIEPQTNDNDSKNKAPEPEENKNTLPEGKEKETSVSEQTDKENDDNQSVETNPTTCQNHRESQSENVSKSQENSENINLKICDKESNCKPEISDQVPDNNENKIVNAPNVIRRWVSKPVIRIPTRKPKPVEAEKSESGSGNSNTNVETSVIEPPEENEILPETEHIEPNTSNESSVTLTESTPVRPLSPNKTLNRSRIRPVPKFIRRSSVQGSASESEDDGKKTNRIRNDSICSTTSQNADHSPNKNVIPVIRPVYKKHQRSEQARKLAEAKRQFHQKFGANTPDKKRLTMFDLIYYNPVTNPMRQSEKKAALNSEPIVTLLNDEEIDDPDEVGNEEESNPVPQVKVGPNGEIILDEQSLVIEQTGAKQGREQLANSQVVVDDNDRAYGIYKKAPRTKEWSARETLRFYKTLNTVGTDFSLMLSLFPGRTRRDLKAKFKREERVNRILIDKCLMNPLQFDLSELEEQLKIDLNTQETKKKDSTPKVKQLGRRKLKSALSRDIGGEAIDIQKRDQTREQKRDLYSLLENSLDSILASDAEDEYKPPKILKIEEPGSRPRRSSRNTRQISYIRMARGDGNESDEDACDSNEENEHAEVLTDTEAPVENVDNQEQAENDNVQITELLMAKPLEEQGELNSLPKETTTVAPGSLMILSTEGEEGQNIFRVYMVTPNNESAPPVIPTFAGNITENTGLLLHRPPTGNAPDIQPA